MKKLLFSLMLIGGGAIAITSCNKIKDQILKNLNPFTKTFDVSFVVNPISGTDYNSGIQTQVININQLIKDNAGGLDVDIDNISEIKAKKVTLKLQDGDDANNWTNLQDIGFVFNTDKSISNSKPTLIWGFNVDDLASLKYSDIEIIPNDLNLKDYFNGDATNVNYVLQATARRPTTKPLNIIATVEYDFKP